MIWRKKHRSVGPAPDPARARADLAKARAQTAKYRDLAESLRELREANNFAAAIETSFRGGKP